MLGNPLLLVYVPALVNIHWFPAFPRYSRTERCANWTCLLPWPWLRVWPRAV